jgi:hypothetical protein
MKVDGQDELPARENGGLFRKKWTTWIWRPVKESQETVAEHEEIPREEAAVETVRAQKERYGDWHLAVGQR